MNVLPALCEGLSGFQEDELLTVLSLAEGPNAIGRRLFLGSRASHLVYVSYGSCIVHFECSPC